MEQPGPGRTTSRRIATGRALRAFIRPVEAGRTAGSRRDLFRAVGLVAFGGSSVAVLGACSDGSSTAPPTGATPSGAAPSSAAPSSAPPSSAAPSSAAPTSAAPTSAAPASAAGTTFAKSAVPEGGGVIEGDYVVTQPTAGEFKAFSSTCTHQGCPVSSVEAEAISCNCHGSQFSIADGSVLNGPAEEPLAAVTLEENGDRLTIPA